MMMMTNIIIAYQISKGTGDLSVQHWFERLPFPHALYGQDDLGNAYSCNV